MFINAYCAECLRDKWLNNCPGNVPDAQAEAYRAGVRRIIGDDTMPSSPEKDYALNLLYREMFGQKLDYAAIKRHFNDLMLSLEPMLLQGVAASNDPLKRAIQYAMTGNFIDFAAMDSVDEQKLIRLIGDSEGIRVDDALLNGLRASLTHARHLTYIADNCGEIVTDKVLMRAIREVNPDMEITAVVKGGPIVNDATLEDAAQVGLSEAAHRVIDTGCPIAGVPLNRVSEACHRALMDAELLISKGQANYETLCGSGLNLYYIFMCKCGPFTERFGVPLYSGIIVRERT